MIYLLLTALREWLENGPLPIWSVAQIFNQISFRALGATFLAFALVLAFGPRTIDWLRRKKIGDAGLADASALAATAKSKSGTPTMGGVLIVGAIAVSTLLMADVTNFYVVQGLTITLWMAVVGGFDDWLKLTAASRPGGSRQGLFAWEKLVFQLGGAALVSYFAFRYGNVLPDANDMAHVLNLPGQKSYEQVLSGGGGVTYQANPALWYLPVLVYVAVGTMLVAGMSNAVNITDGMDGLAAGISAFVALGLLALCLVAGWKTAAEYLLVPHVARSEELGVMAGAMAGACLGFLWFNSSPASVFMGDTGSLALGGLLGFIALVIRQEVVLLFMSIVFLIEIGSVVIQVGYFKLSGGKRVFNIAPYHHNLHQFAKWPEQKVVARFWIVTLLLVVLGIASIKAR
jgi:phospho-N-acetylmuramoyl-pentapeptide-transferase